MSITFQVVVSVIARNTFLMNTCLILNGYRDRAVWIYKYTSLVNGNEEKRNCLLLTLLNFNLSFNDKFFTLRNKFSKIPPSVSMKFTILLRRSLVVHLSWSSHIFMRVKAFKMRVSNSHHLYNFLFLNFVLHTTQRIKT